MHYMYTTCTLHVHIPVPILLPVLKVSDDTILAHSLAAVEELLPLLIDRRVTPFVGAAPPMLGVGILRINTTYYILHATYYMLGAGILL